MTPQDNGRAAAQIFLDMAQVFEFGGEAVILVSQKLLETGSVTVDFDEESQQLDLDLSRMIIGALAVIKPLLAITATNWGMSQDEAIEQLRPILDQTLS